MKIYNRFLVAMIIFLLIGCHQQTQKTDLMRATEQGDLSTVKQLIQQGHDFQERNLQGLDALLYAIINDRVSVVNYLLTQGADVNSTDKLGNSALIIAATVGDLAIVTNLIKHHADINAKNQQGITALMAAAGAGQVKTLTLLLSLGANPCLKNQAQQTALQIAEQWWGTQEIQQMLREHKQLQPLLCETHHD